MILSESGASGNGECPAGREIPGTALRAATVPHDWQAHREFREWMP